MSDSTDPVTAYKDALNEFRAAEHKVTPLVDAIKQTGQYLQGSNWKNVFVSNVGQTFPAGLLSAPTIDGAALPTGAQLGAALSRWHKARQAMLDAWRLVPDEYKSGLEQPPYT
jgi:hypothetical protein